ncbi:hypothetical protein QYE76_010527 [Lolium multiflorum]|uniref:CCHC-type domain-containing protein n=1 Tax=Lolium multiflorum TaxID=4521 RepID=A0AAD8X362_LOLMU|nr:hypothetical protein QYE76_010527 [Lolium multiflorum]
MTAMRELSDSNTSTDVSSDSSSSDKEVTSKRAGPFCLPVFWIVAVPTRTWAASHDLPEPHYIRLCTTLAATTRRIRDYLSPVHCAAAFVFLIPSVGVHRGTIGFRNPASREPVRVRGNQVFGERSGATTGITTSSSDDEFLHTDNFFPNLSEFFDNLNMGDNDAAAKQINSSSVAAATRPPLFDGMHYKRWRTNAVLWFTNLCCFSATDARPEGFLSAEEQEKFEKVDAMFKAALFSILGDNIVDPYMAFDHGKDAWDALEAKFGVSDAGTELYVMKQYYDYRMTDERSVVEQAHEIQSLAKELSSLSVPYQTNLWPKNFQSHKSKNKNNGKGKFEEKNKASNSTNFKRKTPYKKKGNCHVCGAPGHWAPDCPERHDRRGNSGKSANVVIGVDTEMKDVGYGRKDFLCADGKRLTCFCSWCWYDGSEVYFGKDHPAEECAARSLH